MDNITGKVVAITGASSGIGEATALRLANCGAKVLVGARRLDRLESLVKKISQNGGQASCCRLDVSDQRSVQNFINFGLSTYSRLDVLINNAGIMPLSFLAEAKINDWESMIDINFKGVLYGIAAVLPHFQAQNSGHIINVTSVADRVITPTASVYSGTKHAVRAVTEGLRKEVADQGIRVSLIAPGAVETELFDSINNSELKEAMLQRAENALPADSIAKAISYAIEQPADVDISELVIRPLPSSI